MSIIATTVEATFGRFFNWAVGKLINTAKNLAKLMLDAGIAKMVAWKTFILVILFEFLPYVIIKAGFAMINSLSSLVPDEDWAKMTALFNDITLGGWAGYAWHHLQLDITIQYAIGAFIAKAVWKRIPILGG